MMIPGTDKGAVSVRRRARSCHRRPSASDQRRWTWSDPEGL